MLNNKHKCNSLSNHNQLRHHNKVPVKTVGYVLVVLQIQANSVQIVVIRSLRMTVHGFALVVQRTLVSFVLNVVLRNLKKRKLSVVISVVGHLKTQHHIQSSALNVGIFLMTTIL